MSETITVLINGEPFDTIVNPWTHFQAFKPDPGIAYLARRAKVTANELVIATRDEIITIDDLKALLRGMGYSLIGYRERFPEDKIENPLWDD
jgi:hypothetical protein